MQEKLACKNVLAIFYFQLQSSQENIEYIPTRTGKVTASKPAANPLQFVKVGPCDLYRSAQEQIRKVEEVKKIKQEKRDEAEDWQSVSMLLCYYGQV